MSDAIAQLRLACVPVFAWIGSAAAVDLGISIGVALGVGVVTYLVLTAIDAVFRREDDR